MATKKLLFYLSSQHNLIVKLLIFFVSVALIVYIMPVEGKFRYSYVKGKIWLHDDYVAPFDFAINKSPDDEQIEKKDIDSDLSDTGMLLQSFFRISSLKKIF
jgi:hypothetical protein